MLILHGYVRGYDERKDKRIVKGRRIFCSNRNARDGCGKTFALYIPTAIPRIMITAGTAWALLHRILSGDSIEQAYNKSEHTFALSLCSVYRFWARCKNNMHRIRSNLQNTFTLAHSTERSAMCEMLRHLLIHLAHENDNPIVVYHNCFQDSFA